MGYGLLLSTALTPLSLLVLGYHPYAEDGGLYLAGVKYLLNPALFPHQREFVTAPITYSVFAPFLASVVRHSLLPFDVVVFAAFVACLWATIFAGWALACQCFQKSAEQAGATLLFALWLSLPVAGTSLMLIDPYLTARSFSTPIVLLALASAVGATAARRSGDRSRRVILVVSCVALLATAAAFHPLMAGYGVVFVVSLLWLDSALLPSRIARVVSLMVLGILLAACVQGLAPSEPEVFSRVALTRSYWYLAEWQWFEVIGLVAPMLLLGLAMLSGRSAPGRLVLSTILIVGSTALFVALLFARQGLAPSGVAHLQPLRVFQVIYFVLLLTLGAPLGQFVLSRRPWLWGVAIIALSLPILIPSWTVFSHSPHLELPAINPDTVANRWVDAFRWIKRNTPTDALFALDADYISQPGEDAQSFRAIAERSALPDYSKDGGETAVNPKLSTAWATGVDAQQALSRNTDTQRERLLRPLGVTWLVLRSTAETDKACSYDNGTVKVCRFF